MVLGALRRLTGGPKPVVAVFLLLLSALYLLSAATQNSAEFGRLYSLLLVINVVGVILLLTLIGRRFVTLSRQYRKRTPGSRLTVRLVVVFIALAVVPVSVVYYFSLQFLHRGIDSWFDVRVERSLEDALELGRTALDVQLREMLRQTRRFASELSEGSGSVMVLRLNEMRSRAKASEITLLTEQGKVLASSSADQTTIVPDIPDNAILLQLRQGLEYAAVEPIANRQLRIRIAVPVRTVVPIPQGRVLQVIYPVPERLSELAENVQGAYARYKELAFLRQPLKYSFILTLSLVLLLSLLTAVWAAFFSARRVVAPIRDLAEGTRAVAKGDYDKRLPQPSGDELGFLVRSFNEMTRKIALARDQAQRSQRDMEAQHAYLETVLGRLSSGVLTVGADGVLQTANAAAGDILGFQPAEVLGHPLGDIAIDRPYLAPLVEAIAPDERAGDGDWRAEVVLFGSGGRQVLMCRRSALPAIGNFRNGHVIVFDDVTALIQAQRDAAWGEVARRLAHEIKNPLTPIQLSAERLRHKLLARLEPDDAGVLDRSTHTIIQQVEAMKEMVKAFSQYAHTPVLRFEPVDLNGLLDEVLELYRGEEPALRVESRLDPATPRVELDGGRMRQVVHNLIKNAMEAGSASGPVELIVATHCATERACRYVEIRFEDNGPGIPDAIRERLFEPYVTTKPKGTGLGLAIVKKIVEEHGGVLMAENREGGGTVVSIRLPVGSGIR